MGRALVAGLLDDGWTVVTDARHPDTLATTAAELVAERTPAGTPTGSSPSPATSATPATSTSS